jgi:hypothetical protein
MDGSQKEALQYLKSRRSSEKCHNAVICQVDTWMNNNPRNKQIWVLTRSYRGPINDFEKPRVQVWEE